MVLPFSNSLHCSLTPLHKSHSPLFLSFYSLISFFLLSLFVYFLPVWRAKQARAREREREREGERGGEGERAGNLKERKTERKTDSVEKP